MLFYNTKLKKYSQELRRNMTDAEKLLWSRLRRKQIKESQFYRQRIIGNHIVDFYCPKARLIVEIDGGQHYSSDGQKKDRERDAYMARVGMKVLRFSDREVFYEIDGIVEKIYQSL